MADNRINLPGGMGGLMRYDEEYDSKFIISPTHVIGFVIAIIVIVVALKVFLPIG